MSISTAIQNAQEKVRNAYTAVSDKGGTLPTEQNLNNLPEAINSISGGGADTVEAFAIDGAKTAEIDDKVVLNNRIAANEMLMDGVQTPSITYYSGSPYAQPGGFISTNALNACISFSTYSSTGTSSIKGVRESDENFALSKTTDYNVYGVCPLDHKRNIAAIAMYSDSGLLYPAIGIIDSSGNITKLYYYQVSRNGLLSYQMCKDMIISMSRSLLYTDGSISALPDLPRYGGAFQYFYGCIYSEGYYYVFTNSGTIYKYTEGSWAFVGNLSGFASFSRDTGQEMIRSLGSLGECFITKNGSNPILAYKKLSGTFGSTDVVYGLDQDITNSFSSITGDLICCDVQKDDVTGADYVYVADVDGNQVLARFIDGNFETLPPPFDKDVTGPIRSAAMDWNGGLFMCATTDPNISSGTGVAKIYVKSTDVINPYEYVATPFGNRYVVTDSLTGFVTDSREEFGTKILTVETVKPPHEGPYDPTGKFLGFKTTITKGNK